MKIKNRRVIAGMLTVGMMAAAVLASGQENTVSAAAKKVKVNKKSVSVNIGKKATVKVTNAGKNKIKAKSAKKSTATVKVSGKKVVITGKKAGKTKVTVTLKGMKKATVTVTVKAAKTTGVTPTKNTNTTSQPVPDMQTVATESNVNNWLTEDQKKLAANMTITGKKLGGKILLCVTNNNNVAIKVELLGEYFQDVYSNPGALSSGGKLLSANYIAPHGKYYETFDSYQNKKVSYLALSDIKIGGISCDVADNKNRTDVIKTDFSTGNYGIFVARMTESIVLGEDDYFDGVGATYVFKDGAGKVIDAVGTSCSYFDNHVCEKAIYDVPTTYASIEASYNVSLSSE